jgi:histidinol-phosphatase
MPEVPALHRQLAAVAMAAARAGGSAALSYFRRPDLVVEWKSDESPVTVADRACEAAIRQVVRQAFPADAWLGEETGADEGGGSGRRWIVDPIDGTRNFVRGVPLWAVLVACEEESPAGPRILGGSAGGAMRGDERPPVQPAPAGSAGGPPQAGVDAQRPQGRIVAAAVGIPGLDEWYDAVLGGGARCNGVPIQVSALDRLDQALFCYETPLWFRNHGCWGVFEAMLERTALQRGLCDAYGHMLVASGRAEVVVEPKLSVWDVAATSLVVSEAGGRFSDLDGSPSIRSGNAVVSNGLLHDATLALTRARTR